MDNDVLVPSQRPYTEAERKANRSVAEAAWQVRCIARTKLAEARERSHADIERNFYADMSAIDAAYDNAVHDGLNRSVHNDDRNATGLAA